MAKLLIESMTTDWDPTRYQDQYQTALKVMLEAKVAQQPLKTKETPRRVAADALDLVKILQESLASSGGKKVKSRAPAPPRGKSSAAPVKKKRAGGAF